VIVVFLFLRDLRATLVAAVALPLSIIPAFWVMNELGFSLNLVSLLAIILSTGIIIDDAIVEIENIVRHIQMGKSPFQASLDAAEEIGLAVIAISLTIVAVFIPASFMPSIPGQFFKQFGITVSVLVLFSLLCARMITPMLAAYFLKPHHGKEGEPGAMARGYSRVIGWAVRLRFLTVVVGFALLGLSLYGAQFLASGFLPVSDIARSLLAIELPPGTQLQETEAVTNAISERLRKRPEVLSVFVDGGRIPGGQVGVRNAALMINFVNKDKRSISQQKLEQSISKELETIPDIRYWFIDENGQRNVTFIVSGDNNETVANVAAELATQMRRVPSVANVSSGATLNRPELRIYPRRDLAVRLGVSTEALSETIRVATIGDVGPALAKFNAGDRVIPIRVLLDEKARADLKVLEQIRVPTRAGPGIPLVGIADISFDSSPVSISRYDRQRQARVEADLLEGSALSDAAKAVRNLPVVKNLPLGVTVGDGGDAEVQAELFDGFSTAMRNGLIMVYIVLAVLFSSVMHPLTILFSLPLSIAGALAALLLLKLPVTTPVVIGILMLMGIVTKNAIMLVDFAVEAMHAGVDRRTAIIEATVKRTRPIVMTTIAMAAGMMPSALALGAGGEFRSPMAIAVIGGLIASTLLSLLFVPAFFTIMDDIGRLSWKVFGRVLFGRAKKEKEEAPGAHTGPDPAAESHVASSEAAPASGEGSPAPAKS
jgi:multidrug efflux pump subunit AcrB